MFARVLLCYDGSDAGRRALMRGAELAILLKSSVHVLAIIPNGVANATAIASASGNICVVDQRPDYRRLLDGSIEWLKTRGVLAEGHLTSGDTIDQIVGYSQQLAIDLIVLGHYPQPAGGFWWTGAKRQSLAERVRCCVLVAVNVAPETQLV